MVASSFDDTITFQQQHQSSSYRMGMWWRGKLCASQVPACDDEKKHNVARRWMCAFTTNGRYDLSGKHYKHRDKSEAFSCQV
jgi:hypothetical protein